MMNTQYVENKISIVTPVYNSSDTVERAVLSVVEDDWKHKEIILVDDGSTDQTPKTLATLQKKYPEIVRTVRQENAGANAARNYGLRIASGTHVQFLDADDFLTNNKLTACMTLFQKKPELRLVYTNGIHSILGLPNSVIQPNTTDLQNLASRSLTGFTSGLGTNAPIWNRKLLIENNLYWNEHLRCWQETEYFLRVLVAIGDAEKVAHIPEPHFQVVGKPDGISSRYFSEPYIQDQAFALDCIRTFLEGENLWNEKTDAQWYHFQRRLLERSVLCPAPNAFKKLRTTVLERPTNFRTRLMAKTPYALNRFLYTCYKTIKKPFTGSC